MVAQNKYIIALDVGGTFIKSVILNHSNDMLYHTLEVFPAKAKESKEGIINHFIFIIKKQLMKLKMSHAKLIGIGFAFPGPFDYENGISYIMGIDKFDNLYGVNLRKELLKGMKQESSISTKIDNDFRIAFDNDANLFALGEHNNGKGKRYNRAVYLAIGTGAGSAFMEQGDFVKKGNRVPKDGWIYMDPFGDSIVDDYISKRGILQLAQEMNVEIIDNEVKTLADMAINNHEKAREIFEKFGRNIGMALNKYIKRFEPEVIVFGGQISKSIELFESGIYRSLEKKDTVIEVSEDTSHSIFIGIGTLIDNQDSQSYS